MTVLDKLFDFQREDVLKLVDRKGCLVANEMGTGKTYEAIALDDLRRDLTPGPQRTLVVAPMTVLASWEEHFKELTNLKTVVINPKARHKSWQEFTSHGDVFLVHWEALRLMPELTSSKWFHIIADECHRMKNRKAQQTRALKKIKSTYKTALSGTPVVNAPHELWSVLNWLYPNTWGSYWKFYKHHVKYEIMYPQGYHKVVGAQNVEELHQDIGPFYVRRLKKDVLKDLPDKYYTHLWVDLSPSQRRMYNQMKEEMIAWIGKQEDSPLVAPVVVAQLVRLQQFAVASAELTASGVHLVEPSSKLDAFMQILEDNPDEQIVVFSQFKQAINMLSRRLTKEGINHVLLTGDVSSEQRGKNVDLFQTGKAQVFAGTIQAGGVGITLTASSTVVFLDRSWSPAINSQAEDRLHRIGQKNAVQVVDIMARNTVDLGRHQKLELKWSWIREILGDDDET